MIKIPYDSWEPVIGLEIHVQLNTKTKLFSRAPNQFGAEPNTLIGAVDTGQPGTLPVLNRKAVEFAILLGLALGSDVMPFSTFDRKSYFYPDSPRNFQITQFFNPIILSGKVTCDVDGHTKHFSIDRAHLEDDAGMLKHFSSFAGVDYNRAGVPLIEIVSKPVMHSPKDASAFASSLRSILQYLDIAKCNMEEGGMRMDVNISVRPKKETELRPRVEIKNLNSFHNMELAIESEMQRQITGYTLYPHADHEEIVKPGTYRFDLESRKTVLMRSKENSLDYRYFHEPDIPPIILSADTINTIRSQIPELPHQRYIRYVEKLGLSADIAAILVLEKYNSDFFESALTVCKNVTLLANWIIVELYGRFKQKGLTLETSGLSSNSLGHLVKLIEDKTITGRIAKQVIDDMLKDPNSDPREIVKKNPDYQPVSNVKIIEPIIDEVIKNNPQSIADYKSGRKKALAFLIGQVMKQTKGKASPDLVNELMLKKINKL